MKESFSLGHVAGVRIGANWSVIAVAWLIAWSLAAERFPVIAPGYSEGEYWIVGVAASVTFLACLLIHELSHSLVARRFGVGIKGIVLWLFGGVSQLTEDAPSADAEFRIAAAGPAASILIASGFFVSTRVVDGVDGPPLLAAGLGWLGWINGSLAVFNMVPAFPLDGGRVLRAWLWKRHGDKHRATDTAALSGRVFAYVLIGLGLLQFLGGAAVGGLWFVFLGWFLLTAAEAESTQSSLDLQLAGVTVRTAMTPNPVVVPDTTTVAELIEGPMFDNRCSTFPLVDPDGAVSGLITLARLKKVPVAARSTTAALEVAARPTEIVTCQIDDALWSAIGAMGQSADQRALVYAGPTLAGIVSPSDVTRVLNALELRTPGSTTPSRA